MTIISGVKDKANPSQDVNINAGEINAGTDLQKLASALGLGDSFLHDLLNGTNISGNNISLDELVAKAIDKVPTTDVEAEKDINKLNEIKSKLGVLETDIKALETKVTSTTDPMAKAKAQEELDLILKLKAALVAEQEDGKNKLKSVLNSNSPTISEKAKQDIKAFLNIQDPKSNLPPSTPTTPFSGKAMQGGNGSGTSTTNNMTGKAQQGSPYDGILNSGKAWDSGINLGITADSGIGDLYDIQGEQQKRRHQMTMFFYYARRAMSGDVHAMFEFTRFIGWILSKDKALQNVWLGTKLIELQETSRRATERLVNTQVGESAAEQAEWQKELQKIKSEEGVVATSQKLITQMMEEFTQIVEMLMNVQKSLLDANGKILSNLSVWR